MSCDKCNGFMVPEIQEQCTWANSIERFKCFRCINCGNIVDPVILMNRGRARKDQITILSSLLLEILILKTDLPKRYKPPLGPAPRLEKYDINDKSPLNIVRHKRQKPFLGDSLEIRSWKTANRPDLKPFPGVPTKSRRTPAISI